MAINSGFLSGFGFNGVSCQYGAGSSKATLSFNVDTSKGTIRPRDGFVVIKRFYPTATSGTPTKAIAVRTLGIKSVRTQNNFDVILVFMWDENTNHILFAVIDQQGAILTGPKSLSTFPNTVRPGPHMYPVFADFGFHTFISFPSGQVFRYSYVEDPFNIHRAKVGELGSKKNAAIYFDEFPQAKIVYNFGGQMVVAGFDGDEKTAVSVNIPPNQTLVPEDFVDASRGSLNLPRGGIFFADNDDPTAFFMNNYLVVGTGKSITGLYGIGDTLYAFTESETFAGTYDYNRGVVLSSRKIHSGVGCVSQRCIVEGRGLTAFLANDGVYTLNGSSVQKISTDIDDMFSEDGWEMAPMYKLSQDVMGDIPYPFKILQSQLKFACGGYDVARNLFWWSVPVAGTHLDTRYAGNVNHGYDPSKNDATDEMVARVCIVFDPQRNAWNLWGSTDSTAFIPTCFDNTTDGARPRFIFGDEFSGVSAYGEDSSDKLSTDGGGRAFDDGTSFRWFWQSQPLATSGNTAGSARSLRVRQKARGGSLADADKTNWHVETEISFDQPNGELSFNGSMSPNPSELYPKESTPTHI